MFSIAIIGFGVLWNALGTPLFQVPVIVEQVSPVADTTSKLLVVPQIIEIFDNSIDEVPNNSNANGQSTQLVYMKSAFGPNTYSVVPVPRLKFFSGKRPSFFWSGPSSMKSRTPVVNETAKPVVAPVARPLPIGKKSNSTS
ncbi:uncharacterized protein LOC106666985 [Cimex lectularius]|uniref:Uncharacterized protein n=1 Tax=Cimex lectularius TaxID=79782 RepID=A0A8I6RR39_CIMLE|nr:uncharacterized protein LOC106666985 [Cimex lectularius]